MLTAAGEAMKAWCEAHGTDHAHCPLGCSHPQPFLLDGVMVCGRCYFVEGAVTAVEPCVPGVCED